MTRFAGIKGNRLCIISSEPIINQELEAMELPTELDEVASVDLIGCKVIGGQVKCKAFNKPLSQMKIAFVGNWQMACGISTYNKHLFPEVANGVEDFKLFAEKNDAPTGDIHQFGTQILRGDQLSICWKRGESLQELAQEIDNYSPDIVLISHEYGIFPHAGHWLSFLTQLSDYRVIVILHSVFPNHFDKMLYEAPMSEIVVHLEDARQNLMMEKKVNAKVSMIPHGCYSVVEDQSRLWNNYKSEHTFIQTGFSFHYKRFDHSVRATALLKDKYPDIFFTAILAESPHNKSLHQAYHNFLMDLIVELGVQENVGLIRGFQPDNIINTFLRSSRVAVFPYSTIKNHECMGSSGSARLAMSCGLPVISSNIFHFKDLPTMRADTPEEIAQALDQMFCSETLRREQVNKQNQFIETHSWQKVAQQFLSLIENP